MPKYYNALLVIRKEADTHYTAGPTQGHLLNSGGLFVSSTEHIVLDTLLLSTSLGQMPLLGTASLDKELWLQALNMNKDEHWRIRVYATDIDSNGLTVHTNKWGDSILYFASVTWLAYPADRPGVTSGKFDTQEVRPWNKPQHENSGFKSFGMTFSKTPKVIMALDFLDYDHSRNLRVRLSTSSVTNYGLTWHLISWHDSIMYTTGASFFAWT